MVVMVMVTEVVVIEAGAVLAARLNVLVRADVLAHLIRQSKRIEQQSVQLPSG
jgi:hypothetical protein